MSLHTLLRRLEPPAPERGNTIVIFAFFIASFTALAGALIGLSEVRQAQLAINAAVDMAASDGLLLDLPSATLRPGCPTPPCLGTLKLVLTASTASAAEKRARSSLAANLASVAYLLREGVTPEDVAAKAEIKVINPSGGKCVTNPFSSSGNCYYDPIVAIRVEVPLNTLWGSLPLDYVAVGTGTLTDNELNTHRATPIPTSTPAPMPTFILPKPTCDPSICS